MKREVAGYLRLQATVAAAFNFFIGGMIAALIYHKVDFVPTNAFNIAIDITITCLLTFAITTPFCMLSLRRDKTGGVLVAKTPLTRLFAWLSSRPALLCISLALCAALILFALAASLLAFLNVTAMPFYLYIVLKSIFSSVLGASATYTMLCAGIYGESKTSN